MRGVLLGAAGLALVMLVPRADGAGCRTRAVYSAYVAPAVSYSSYSSYVAPAYLKAVVSPDVYKSASYSSVSDYYRDSVLVDAVAGRTAQLLRDKQAEQLRDQEVLRLREELQQLRLMLQSPEGRPPGVRPPPDNGRERGREPEPLPEPRERGPRREPPPDNRGKERHGTLPPTPQGLAVVVRDSCLRCHGGSFERHGDGIDLRDLDAVPRETRLLAKAAIDDGTMPRGGKPVSDEAVALFHEWSTGRKVGRSAQK